MKTLVQKFRNATAFVVGFALVALAGPALAAGTYDGITGAVDWSDVITAITAIGALVAAVLVVARGTRMVLRMIGR